MCNDGRSRRPLWWSSKVPLKEEAMEPADDLALGHCEAPFQHLDRSDLRAGHVHLLRVVASWRRTSRSRLERSELNYLPTDDLRTRGSPSGPFPWSVGLQGSYTMTPRAARKI